MTTKTLTCSLSTGTFSQSYHNVVKTLTSDGTTETAFFYICQVPQYIDHRLCFALQFF